MKDSVRSDRKAQGLAIHILRFSVASLSCYVLIGCAVENPRWSSWKSEVDTATQPQTLSDRDKSELIETLRKKLENKDPVYDPNGYAEWWSNPLNGVPPEEAQAFLRESETRQSINSEKYLYDPDPVDTFRARPFDDLKYSMIVDAGTDDPGEIDLFDDNKLTASLSFIGVDIVPPWRAFNWARDEHDMEWRRQKWYRSLIPRAIGMNFSLGVGITEPDGLDRNVVVGLISGGVFLEWFDFLGIEAGGLQGISPDGSLDSTERDDSGWYFGARLDIKRFATWTRAVFKNWSYHASDYMGFSE